MTQIKITLVSVLPLSYGAAVSSTSAMVLSTYASTTWLSYLSLILLWFFFFSAVKLERMFFTKWSAFHEWRFSVGVMNLKRITNSHWTGPKIYVLSLANNWIWLWSQIRETKHAGRFYLFIYYLMHVLHKGKYTQFVHLTFPSP